MMSGFPANARTSASVDTAILRPPTRVAPTIPDPPWWASPTAGEAKTSASVTANSRRVSIDDLRLWGTGNLRHGRMASVGARRPHEDRQYLRPSWLASCDFSRLQSYR